MGGEFLALVLHLLRWLFVLAFSSLVPSCEDHFGSHLGSLLELIGIQLQMGLELQPFDDHLWRLVGLGLEILSS